MYYVCTYSGFLGHGHGTTNFRWARPFPSFEEADEFAKRLGLHVYCVVKSCLS